MFWDVWNDSEQSDVTTRRPARSRFSNRGKLGKLLFCSAGRAPIIGGLAFVTNYIIKLYCGNNKSMHLESSYIRRLWYHCKHYLQDLETFSHWFCIIFKAEFKWIRIPESILLIKMLCSSCRTETLLNSKTTSLLTQKTSAVITGNRFLSLTLCSCAFRSFRWVFWRFLL